MVYGILAAVYGILMSIQAAFCADLTECYGNWFSTVTVHLSGFLALSPFFFTKWGKRTGRAPWYFYLGGVIGVANVALCNYGVVHLGMTNSNVLMLMGEIVFAAALDSLGILGANKRRITGRKWAAVAIMLAGVLSIALLTGEAGAHFSLLAVLASLLRGVAMVISRQLNGQLGIRAGTGYATYMNYVTGLAAAIAIFAALGFPMQAAFPSAVVPVWTYLCGAIGCCGIFLCNLSSPRLSALTMSLLVFVSQTGAGMAFDLTKGRLSMPTVIGCAVVSVGMVVNLTGERRE
ncbi:MAG: DMT family transporter [Candidatus Faecousia sp.]|nr:DMT family transporter [Candidatus Faecousia sp.]